MMIEEGKNTLNSWSFFGRGLCSQSSYMYLFFKWECLVVSGPECIPSQSTSSSPK